MHDPAEENRRRAVHGLAAGAVATVLMTGLAFVAPALGAADLPAVAERVLATLRARPLLVAVALALHFGYGGLAGALYGVGARRIHLASGLVFGAALWGVAVAVYAPLVGLGFVARHAPGLAALALPPHLLYGLTLGAMAPRGEIVHPIRDQMWPTPITQA
jgi:hypothetical protein